MRYILYCAAVILLLPLPSIAGGHKGVWISGTVAPLKDVRRMNVIFEYDSMTIGVTMLPEKAYVERRTKELEMAVAGRGDWWAERWVADRKLRYEPAFKDHFMRHTGVELGDFPDAQYTMIFKTLNLEPGFNVYIVNSDSWVSGEAWIVETANREHVICKMGVYKSTGKTREGEVNNGARITMAYVGAGYAIGKLYKKKIGT